jgi:membrane-bound lytic murein transglycosylase D
MTLLPPTTRNRAVPTVAEAPPPIQPNLYLPESPSFVNPELQTRTLADSRIRRAESLFQQGKTAYLSGDMDRARSSFDAAVDSLLSTPDNLPERHKVERKLEDLVGAIHRYDVNGMGAGDLSAEPSYDKAPLEDILEMTFPVDPNMKPKVKEQLHATVSQLPLELNDAVLSYINYFSTEKGRRTLIAGLERAGKYKPLIQRILAEEGVPQELIYLAQAESGFLPRARSHKSAVGMWQFVRARGRQYGLTQTAYSDERLDPEKATRSAARHLRDLYEKFGDWYLAIAGYNCGDGCIERAVERTGYADFWRLRSLNAIPRETTNYVPIILAFTIMHKNAKEYGIEDIEPDEPITYDTLELEAATHLALVADAASRPVSVLRELNPALLKNVAPTGYPLHIPVGTKAAVIAGLETVPAKYRASWRIHRVETGDTLASIARRYRMSVDSIAAANETSDAEIGDVLIIPTRSEVERQKPGKKRSGRSTVRRTSTGSMPSKNSVQTASLR